jgi:hypothetical protein
MSGTIPLVATPVAGHQLGPAPWHGTIGDHGTGDPGTTPDGGPDGASAASVLVEEITGCGIGPVCVWVCCPEADGGGCPTTDPCP